jgi:hypothetical protein
MTVLAQALLESDIAEVFKATIGISECPTVSTDSCASISEKSARLGTFGHTES